MPLAFPVLTGVVSPLPDELFVSRDAPPVVVKLRHVGIVHQSLSLTGLFCFDSGGSRATPQCDPYFTLISASRGVCVDDALDEIAYVASLWELYPAKNLAELT